MQELMRRDIEKENCASELSYFYRYLVINWYRLDKIWKKKLNEN